MVIAVSFSSDGTGPPRRGLREGWMEPPSLSDVVQEFAALAVLSAGSQRWRTVARSSPKARGARGELCIGEMTLSGVPLVSRVGR